MNAHAMILLIPLASSLSACSFLGDVAHSAGDFGHGVGNAFENQAARDQEKAPPNDMKGKASTQKGQTSPNGGKGKAHSSGSQ